MKLNNEVIIAAAGSGKTSYLIREALADSSKTVLIVTYTNENLGEIDARLWAATNGHPPHVETMTLFEFLLRECVKPYQTYKGGIAQINSVNFTSENPPRVPRKAFRRYYLDSSNSVYRDAVSDLACVLDEDSGGKVISRLESIYDKIMFDEMQDLAGWDLEFLGLLFRSAIDVTLVGDPRQAVYLSNRSNRNSQFRGANFANWIEARVVRGECMRTPHAHSYRCVQSICDFADSLYPDLVPTVSRNAESSGHDGVFLIHESDVELYRAKYAPQELRWDRKNRKASPNAKNFGKVKGLTFPRVLIHPTATIMKFLESGAELADGTRAKFYVALTRAQQSVAIVSNKRSTKSELPIWHPTAGGN